MTFTAYGCHVVARHLGQAHAITKQEERDKQIVCHLEEHMEQIRAETLRLFNIDESEVKHEQE